MKFEQSSKWLERAKQLIPSASQTYSKSYEYYCTGAAPTFLDRGEGAYVWDVDGNKFVDFVLALGAVSIGYNHPEINMAIEEQLKKGISFSQPHKLEVQLAEKLIQIIPCAEMIRFMKNGSDATSAAVRLSRAYTGREMIAFCGYHGFQDWYVGSTTNHKGVPEIVRQLTKPFQYNRLDSLAELFEQYPGQIAAVIMEPLGLEAPKEDFLTNVKELAHSNGALLIFDEVITGFRLSLGGAQDYFGITPDLCAIGKGMANGMPISAVAGRRDVMQLIDRGVFISMTFGGETLSLASALATLAILERKGTYEHIWNLGEKWLQGCKELIVSRNLQNIVETTGFAPHSGVVFRDYGKVAATEWLSLYQQELISRGILTLGINNYCLAHKPEDIQKYLQAVDAACDKLIEAKTQGSVDPFLRGKKIRPIFKRN
jgi:glutamate-1-semialdehyde aminotransferase